VPGATVTREKRDGGESVQVRVLVRQLYPLKVGQAEIAFDFCVGETAWSTGFLKTIEPSLFGVLSVTGGRF